MDTSFFAYLQQLELMAFFSGYPLLYAIVRVIAGNTPARTGFKSTIFYLVPLAYALAGSLYLALQLKNLYPDYSIGHIQVSIQQPFWTAWAILSVLFWLPALHKRPVLSLLHSTPFFFFLVRDLFLHAIHPGSDNSVVKNDMKIYTDSLLLYFGALIFVTLIFFLIKRLNIRN